MSTAAQGYLQSEVERLQSQLTQMTWERNYFYEAIERALKLRPYLDKPVLEVILENFNPPHK